MSKKINKCFKTEDSDTVVRKTVLVGLKVIHHNKDKSSEPFLNVSSMYYFSVYVFSMFKNDALNLIY